MACRSDRLPVQSIFEALEDLSDVPTLTKPPEHRPCTCKGSGRGKYFGPPSYDTKVDMEEYGVCGNILDSCVSQRPLKFLE
jgi:hypothetical protein